MLAVRAITAKAVPVKMPPAKPCAARTGSSASKVPMPIETRSMPMRRTRQTTARIFHGTARIRNTAVSAPNAAFAEADAADETVNYGCHDVDVEQACRRQKRQENGCCETIGRR